MYARRLTFLASTAIVAALFVACSSDGTDPTGSETAPSVAQVDVSPAGQLLTSQGATLQFSAVALDAEGNPVPGVEFAWSSSDPNVVTVDGTGLATAVGEGSSTISATAQEVTGAASVSVDLLQLSVAEAEALADQLAGATIAGIEFGIARAFSGAPAAGNAPPEFSISFEFSHDCPQGGSTELSGTLSGEVDPAEGQASFQLDATKVIDGCAFQKDDVLITLDTEEPIVVDGDAEVGGGSASATLSVLGVVIISFDDGRPDESCEIDVTIEWSSEYGHTVEGTICGMELG